MKMFIEGLDELFAASDAKLDALCARSGACASGGSGVVGAAVAQEVIPDLELAAAATSATYVEPCVANIGSPSNCSMEVPNHVTDPVAPVPVCAITAEYRVVDFSMLVPACTIAEEIIPDTDLVVAVSSATIAVPSNINIGTSSSCSKEFPSLVIDAPALVPVAAAVIPDHDHVPTATSVVCIEPSAVSDEPDATTAMSGHKDMASRHQASATLATTDKELFPDPIFAADACSAMGIELSTIHISVPVPVAYSTKCPIVFIDITAPAAVYATAEVTLDLFHAPPSGVLTVAFIGIILSDRPDIIMDVGLPASWTDVPLMLEPSCEVSALISWFPLDWIEQQPWPPPTSLKFITHDPVLRPLSWPSFASGFPSIQLRYFCLARAQSNVMICYQYSCLSWMGILCFLKIEPEQQHNVGSEFLRPILTAEFSEVIFGHHIVDHCAAIYVLVADTCTGALITVHELLAWLGCEIVEEPVQRKCGEIGELHLDSKKNESESLPSVGLLDMEQKQLVKICCRCIQKKLLQIPARSMGFGDIVVIFLMPELAIDSELKELWVLGGARQLEQSVREHEQVTLALLFCPGLILSGTIASEFSVEAIQTSWSSILKKAHLCITTVHEQILWDPGAVVQLLCYVRLRASWTLRRGQCQGPSDLPLSEVVYSQFVPNSCWFY
ncbi:hypothetical protein EJB05_28040, partial [Eragrostis curvula]